MQYLNEILGIKYPFIQGGMANVATGAFAAAVSNAGALGIIGSGGMNAEKLEEHIRICKSLTDKPFGVNLMLMNPDTPRMAKLVAGSGVKVVTTGAGSPQKYVKMWKEAGILVIPVCASVLLAQQLVRAGADMIIAEGTESGGHVGEMTTLTLVPQMVDGVDVPVIAAGGIADGFKAGDFMLIEDHISLFAPNPLIGPNEDELGVRFPDMSKVYRNDLNYIITSVAKNLGIPLKKGIYVQLTGPSYESPAEIQLLKKLGISAVGMSTVVEAIAANNQQSCRRYFADTFKS